MAKGFRPAVADLRTSSASYSDKRQRAAIDAFAKSAKFTIVKEYYDAAVSGGDHVDQRPDFPRCCASWQQTGQRRSSLSGPIGSPATSPSARRHDGSRRSFQRLPLPGTPNFFTGSTPSPFCGAQVLAAIVQSRGPAMLRSWQQLGTQAGARGTVRGKKASQ